MNRLLSITPLFILAIGSGCSSNVNHAQAVKVMDSALVATVAADGKVMSANWTPTSGQVNVTLTNALGGGSAQIVGSASDNAGVIDTALDISFNHWVDLGANLTLDGSLHERGSFTSSSPLVGSIELSGALAADGSVKGAVDFDIKGSYAPGALSLTGDVGGQAIGGGVSVSVH